MCDWMDEQINQTPLLTASCIVYIAWTSTGWLSVCAHMRYLLPQLMPHVRVSVFLFLAVKHYCYTADAGNCFKPWKKTYWKSSEIWLMASATIFSIGMNHLAKNCWCFGISVNATLNCAMPAVSASITAHSPQLAPFLKCGSHQNWTEIMKMPSVFVLVQ